MRILSALLLLAGLAWSQTPATKRWWGHVRVLADDKLEGRDTGSEGYRTAARYVVDQFQKAGLQPVAGDGFYQSVPLKVLTLRPDSTFTLVRGGPLALHINEQIGLTPRAGLPETIDAPLQFAGTEDADVAGRIVVVIAGTRRAPVTGAVAVISIDNPNALEAPRWPIAYARSMSVEGIEPRTPAATGVTFRFNPEDADTLFAGTGRTFASLLALGAAGKPIPAFPLPASFRATIHVDVTSVTSDNIIAVLPGGDLKDEYVVVSAHLDGYGIGTPVKGDRIYNGAFDDAACVSNLIELAADLKRGGTKLRRSVLFAVFTGEEKGLLGSQYFTAHFTVPKEQIVADINLDYIRPLFPLKRLTVLGLEESTLGATARTVAEKLNILVQPDNEPERGLFRRSDQYNFIRAGIPGIAFIFGYEKGSREETIYRDWYKSNYHKPADDSKQLVDWVGAAQFHRFFSAMTEAVANADARPESKK